MLHKAWNSKEEKPYFFPRSLIKFQGHTGQNITDFDPNWAFPDYRPVAAFKSLRFALFTKKCIHLCSTLAALSLFEVILSSVFSLSRRSVNDSMTAWCSLLWECRTNVQCWKFVHFWLAFVATFLLCCVQSSQYMYRSESFSTYLSHLYLVSHACENFLTFVLVFLLLSHLACFSWSLVLAPVVSFASISICVSAGSGSWSVSFWWSVSIISAPVSGLVSSSVLVSVSSFCWGRKKFDIVNLGIFFGGILHVQRGCRPITDSPLCSSSMWDNRQIDTLTCTGCWPGDTGQRVRSWIIEVLHIYLPCLWTIPVVIVVTLCLTMLITNLQSFIRFVNAFLLLLCL